jgi:hypothetical protein
MAGVIVLLLVMYVCLCDYASNTGGIMLNGVVIS